MRRFTCLVAIMAVCTAGRAQSSLDFALKFMQKCKDDTVLQCITVSPKMMEQLTKQQDAQRDEHIQQAIQKLKSARIITANSHSSDYYQKAEDLLKKNSQRFEHSNSYTNENAHGDFYVRKLKSGKTVELIMLRADSKADKMVIVNLTGDIDEEFINSLQNKE